MTRRVNKSVMMMGEGKGKKEIEEDEMRKVLLNLTQSCQID